jgi:HEAT repeat protein
MVRRGGPARITIFMTLFSLVAVAAAVAIVTLGRRAVKPVPAVQSRTSAGTPGTSPDERFGAGPYVAEEAVRRDLAKALDGLSAAGSDAKRRNFFESMRCYGNQLTPHLATILAGESRLVAPAMTLCAGLKLKESRPELERLARLHGSQHSAEALRAADAIVPWTVGELIAFLDSPDASVVEAAVRLLGDRDERPVPRIVDLLRHPDWSVRNAAVEALPPLRADDATILDLMAIARDSDVDNAIAGIKALERAGVSDRSEDCLSQLLTTQSPPAVRNEALAVLGRKSTPLRKPLALLAVAGDATRGVEERAQAILAWERTRSIPVREIHELLPRLQPILRLFAARCLAVAGDERVLPLLIELLATSELDYVPRREAAATRDGARAILIELAGTDHGSSVELWRRWQQGQHRLEPGDLTCPPPRDW